MKRVRKAFTVDSNWVGEAVFDIIFHGAQGAPFDDTEAVMRTIEACYKARGGLVYIPRTLAQPGCWKPLTQTTIDQKTAKMRLKIVTLELKLAKAKRQLSAARGDLLPSKTWQVVAYKIRPIKKKVVKRAKASVRRNASGSESIGSASSD